MPNHYRGLIVLIEDDQEMQNTLREYLEQIGYRVTAFSDPQKAIEYFAGQDKVFWESVTVVTDFGLPGMNGLELVRNVRKFSATTPIVMISAIATASQKKQALSQGRLEFLDKPFELRALKTLLKVRFAEGSIEI